MKARVRVRPAHNESARSSSKRGNVEGGDDVGDRDDDRSRLTGSPPSHDDDVCDVAEGMAAAGRGPAVAVSIVAAADDVRGRDGDNGRRSIGGKGRRQ